MIEASVYKERLLSRQAELETKLARIEHDLDEPVSPDFEDRATEREDDEVMEAIGNSGLDEMAAIGAALSRIEAGTYGICVKCGESISPERLNIIPTATICRNCM